MVDIPKEFANLPQEKFGDSDQLADELSELILRGIKTATCSAYDPEYIISPGYQAIVLNGAGDPVCVIETTRVENIRFDQIDADFARQEGEDDLSHDYWRREHQRFFERAGIFKEDMLLQCEWIKVIYKF